ncbi:MAG: HAMP domain-containing histidine kinase, partial [Sphingomonadales bacterium]|nr:HAMP domain-containing histidine kinase [Sphingomonadales bacterium]
ALGPVVRAVVADMMPFADARAIDLGVVGETEIDVPVPEFELASVLRNLVDNALRHGRQGGAVDVVVEQAPDCVTIRVCDDGPGIPADARATIFEPFRRLASDSEGSGLGLAIVKAIADRRGAALSLGDGPGTTVSFSLPCLNPHRRRGEGAEGPA